MISILKKALLKKPANQAGGRPPVAVEIAAEGVLAAALPGPGQPAVYAFEPLPSEFVIPGIGATNVRAPEAVVSAIRSALEQVSPRTRAVTLIVPDTVVRVFVLDFDSLPDNPAEALPVLRFRLRKMLPFDVEHAGISYQILSENKDECKVLVAVMPGGILAEYEGIVRAAGYEPGVVLSSSLAILEAVDSMEAVLLANLSSVALTTAITNGQDLLLYRTIELPTDPDKRLAELQRGVAVAAAYFEDRLGVRPTRLYYSGCYATKVFAKMLENPDLNVVDLVQRTGIGAATTLGETSIAAVASPLVGTR